MNTKHIGDISEAKIIASLLASGRTVLKPVGDNQRFDLVLFDDPKFLRVQVKTGRIDSFNSVRFSVCSLSSKNVGALTYKSHHVSYTKDKWNCSAFTAQTMIAATWFQLSM